MHAIVKLGKIRSFTNSFDVYKMVKVIQKYKNPEDHTTVLCLKVSTPEVCFILDMGFGYGFLRTACQPIRIENFEKPYNNVCYCFHVLNETELCSTRLTNSII